MAYIIPAALVWGVLAVAISLLNVFPLLLPLLAWAYALWFGMREAFSIGFRVPSIDWQVPSGWINSRSSLVRSLIWGSILGPGLITRNIYAGMWLFPLLLAFNHNLLLIVLTGIAVGIAHGGGRVLGILSNLKDMQDDTELADLRILGMQLRWQYWDGLALLLAAGALTVYLLSHI